MPSHISCKAMDLRAPRRGEGAGGYLNVVSFCDFTVEMLPSFSRLGRRCPSPGRIRCKDSDSLRIVREFEPRATPAFQYLSFRLLLGYQLADIYLLAQRWLPRCYCCFVKTQNRPPYPRCAFSFFAESITPSSKGAARGRRNGPRPILQDKTLTHTIKWNAETSTKRR